MTLGCGAVGGSSISDNVDASHLMNVRKVAYGLPVQQSSPQSVNEVGDIDIERITARVLAELRQAVK